MYAIRLAIRLATVIFSVLEAFNSAVGITTWKAGSDSIELFFYRLMTRLFRALT